MFRVSLISAFVLCSACSDYLLDQADKEVGVFSGDGVTRSMTLAEAAHSVDQLSQHYAATGRKVANWQDVYAFLVTGASLASATGLVKSASDEVLLKRAAVGVLASQTGARGTARLSITGIYTGAQQLNCIAAVARIGDAGNELADSQAVPLVISAARHVMYSTRKALAREPAAFEKTFKEFSDAFGQQGVGVLPEREGARENREVEKIPLAVFSKMLSTCTNSDAKPPVVPKIPK